MGTATFHPLGWYYPQRLAPFDLLPTGSASLARPDRIQDRDFERKTRSRVDIGLSHFGKSSSYLAGEGLVDVGLVGCCFLERL